MSKYSLKNDYFEMEIKSATYSKILIELTFFDKEIPEQELRKLEAIIRLLLEACGRFEPNPSRR